MCFPLFTSLGSLFLLFSFVLELFILIGQLSNKVFLRDLSFGSAWNTGQNTRYNVALWNYCSADVSGTVNSCAHPKAAFNWANTPDISNFLQTEANSGFINSLFMATFVLFFIACGWSFLLWLASMPICCFRRRFLGYSMFALTFINFLVMLAALILVLVNLLSGVKYVTANPGWNAHAGNLLWIAIGATVSLLIASMFFICGSVGGKSRRSKKVRDEDKNNYNDYNHFLPYSSNPTYQDSHFTGGYTNAQYHQQNHDSVQTPMTSHQELPGNSSGANTMQSPVQAHSPHVNGLQNQDHSHVSNVNGVPTHDQAHGYQTPTLEPANTVRLNMDF
ncbi:SUR7/PalI family-domain-containing protein [Sporodiniella umbellata]|nr:SUR7/PalI family-domain-containing protein [Sporodiniella umbellata]